MVIASEAFLVIKGFLFNGVVLPANPAKEKQGQTGFLWFALVGRPKQVIIDPYLDGLQEFNGVYEGS
jgi:hypothetical protein